MEDNKTKLRIELGTGSYGSNQEIFCGELFLDVWPSSVLFDLRPVFHEISALLKENNIPLFQAQYNPSGSITAAVMPSQLPYILNYMRSFAEKENTKFVATSPKSDNVEEVMTEMELHCMVKVTVQTAISKAIKMVGGHPVYSKPKASDSPKEAVAPTTEQTIQHGM